MRKKSNATKSTGQRLQNWRKSQNQTGADLAKIIGISQSSLSELENQKALPSADTIAKLHHHTDLNVIWLLTGEGPISKKEFSSEVNLPFSAEGENSYGQDQGLKELIETLISIYKSKTPETVDLVKEFLICADLVGEKKE